MSDDLYRALAAFDVGERHEIERRIMRHTIRLDAVTEHLADMLHDLAVKIGGSA